MTTSLLLSVHSLATFPMPDRARQKTVLKLAQLQAIYRSQQTGNVGQRIRNKKAL